MNEDNILEGFEIVEEPQQADGTLVEFEQPEVSDNILEGFEVAEEIEPIKEDEEESGEKLTAIEKIPGIGKNEVTDFFGDISRAWTQGVEQAKSVDPSLDIFYEGNESTDEEILKFIEANKNLAEVDMESDEMKSFNKIYEEEGGGWTGFILGALSNPTTLTSMLVSSISGQINAIRTSEQVAAAGVAGAGVGAGTALIAGQLGPQIGLPEELITVPMGAITGLMTGSMTAMETGLTFAELLQEQVVGELTKEKIRAILDDPEKLHELRKKSAGRGLAIGAVEAATMGLSKGVGGKLASAGFRAAPLVGAAVTGGIEIVGGGFGEVAGRAVAGQEMDIAEIGFEAFAGLGSMPLTAGQQILNINTNIDRVRINNQLKNTEYNNLVEAFDPSTDVTEADLNISQIKNSTKILDEQVDTQVKNTQITPEQGEAIKKNFRATQSATNKAKRANLKGENEVEVVALLKEKEVLDGERKAVNESSLTKTQEKRVKEIDARLEEISSTVTDVVKEDRKAQVEESVKFAETEGKKFGLKTEAVDSKTEFGERFGKEAAESDGFIQDGTIYINKEVAQETGAVSVGSHELLHGILNKELKGKDATKLVQDFRSQLNENQLNVLDSKLQAVDEKGNRLYSDDYLTKNPDEALTLFSDAVAKKEIAYDENVFTKLKDFLTPILRKAGFAKIKFETGKDVYNFLREYNKSVKEGKLSEAISELGTKETVAAKSVQEVQNPSIETEEKIKIKSKPGLNVSTKETIDSYELEGEEKQNRLNSIDNQIKKDIKEGKSVKEIVQGIERRLNLDKKSKNKITLYINDLVNKKTTQSFSEWNNSKTTSTKQKSNIESKNNKKFSKTPAKIEDLKSVGEDAEVIEADQVEKMAGRVAGAAWNSYGSKIPKNILEEAGITRKSYVDSAKNSILGSKWIKKWDGTRQPFNQYIANKGMLELKTLATELGVRSAENQTTRITEDTKQIAAEEETSRDTRTEREVRQDEREGIKVREKLPKVYDIDKVVKSIRLKAKSLKAKNLKQLKGTSLEEISIMIGRDDAIGKSIFNKISKNADLNKVEMLAVQKFINSNTDVAKVSLIEGYTSDFKATGVVNKLLEKFYNKRSVRSKTGAGLQVQIKKPNISDIEFKEAFGITGKDQNNWNQKVPSKKGGVSDILKGFVRNFDQVISSQEIREQLIQDGEAIEALRTLRDGIPPQLFSKSTKEKLFAAENLGKTFNKLNEDQKLTYLANLPMFIELLATKGITPDTAFRLAYDTFLYNKKGTKPLSIREEIVDSWKDIVDQAPKTLYDSKKPDKFQLNEYLYRSFDEQTDVDSIKENLGISKEGVNFREEDQILGYLSLMSEYFGDLQQEFNNDAEFFQYVVQHFEQTFTSAAKIGGLPNHVWKQIDGVWKLVEGKKSGRGSDLRFGLFNNKTEFFNVLLKPFDTENKLKLVNNKLVYDGEKIVTKRAPQSTAAKNKYLKEFIKDGKLSNKSLLLSYNDATSNQDAIIRELKWYKDNKGTKADVTTNDLGMFLAASVGDMTAILRSAYYIDSIALSESKKPSDYTYEHNPPVKVMQNYLVQFVNGDITETELKQKFKDSSTSVIPNLMDKAINIRYKSSIPQNSISRFDRYYNPTTYGKFPSELTVYTPQFNKEGNVTSFKKSVKGKDLNKAYKDEQAAIKANKQEASDSQVIDSKDMTNEEMLKQFSKTDKALDLANSLNQTVKKIEVDFDTLNISNDKARAQWLIGKAAQGYNDFYFSNNAMANTSAVKKVMSVLDIKSKVQKDRIKFSKNLNEDFNRIIEETEGIGREKIYSEARAKQIGSKKGKRKFWIPFSAEDMLGLIYPLLGKGKTGNAQMKFFKDNLFNPFSKAMESLAAARVQLMADFKALKENLDVPKDLQKEAFDGFTNEQALRMYIWDSQGMEVPGASKRDVADAKKIIEGNEKLKTFAEELIKINKEDGYPKPSQSWLAGTITTDLIEGLNDIKRPRYLQEWQQNVDAIFSKENLNKLEAIHGSNYREAVENMLTRMKTGKNRIEGSNRMSDRVLDWINGSVGAIMFFNTRSAVLQLISSINFINWNDNNLYAAGKAFANQPQYWSDFKMLINSDFLVDRRNGLKINVSESEIADAAKTSKNKARAVLNYILKKGFLPTQIADSFAIASGGATFYRNRVNTYLSEGMTKADAEAQAFQDFRETSEESQQSSRPDKVSQQQASSLGRVLLAFANTPMQYGRLTKRAYQDLVAGRGDRKSNISKIIYYTAVQNMIFNVLQQAVTMLGFGDDEKDDDEKEEKYVDVANGMADSILRGLGIAGSAVSVGKNFLLDLYERSGRTRPEYVDSVYKLLQFSPPISSKVSKIRQAAWMFDSKKRREEIYDKGFALDNPAYEAAGKVISATTNLPVDRVYNKVNNIDAALAEDTETWESIAMLLGWPEWQIKPNKKKNKSKKSGYKSDFKKRKNRRNKTVFK